MSGSVVLQAHVYGTMAGVMVELTVMMEVMNLIVVCDYSTLCECADFIISNTSYSCLQEFQLSV